MGGKSPGGSYPGGNSPGSLLTNQIFVEMNRKKKKCKAKCVLRVSLKFLRSIDTIDSVLFFELFCKCHFFCLAINLPGFIVKRKNLNVVLFHIK